VRLELTLSVPRDPRYLATVRALAVQAAASAGLGKQDAAAFGQRVEEMVRAGLGNGAGDHLPVVLRLSDGPLEIIVDARSVTLEV
jgi:hypothetical protein